MQHPPPALVDPLAVLDTLPAVILLIDDAGSIRFVNGSAENLFQSSAAHLCGRPVTDFLPIDSQILSVVAQARSTGLVISEHGIGLDTPRTGKHTMTIQAAPMLEQPGAVLLSMSEQLIAVKIGGSLVSRNAARSVTAMAALLAHEVKNPLSGIRGAAQLLDGSAGEADRILTRLIMDETDRIVALVERMEIFSDKPVSDREALNIHQVLERVRRIAENGFARTVRIIENYDPSLPLVFGSRDQLIQVFLNLVKNAAEAVPASGGEIVISTAYRHGVRLAIPGNGDHTRRYLPLLVTIQDNGPGIPDDMKPHLFDAFISTKIGGGGLGLPLVAKIVGDHGGIVEFDSQPRRTLFRVMLPTLQEGTQDMKSGSH